MLYIYIYICIPLVKKCLNNMIIIRFPIIKASKYMSYILLLGCAESLNTIFASRQFTKQAIRFFTNKWKPHVHNNTVH